MNWFPNICRINRQRGILRFITNCIKNTVRFIISKNCCRGFGRKIRCRGRARRKWMSGWAWSAFCWRAFSCLWKNAWGDMMRWRQRRRRCGHIKRGWEKKPAAKRGQGKKGNQGRVRNMGVKPNQGRVRNMGMKPN